MIMMVVLGVMALPMLVSAQTDDMDTTQAVEVGNKICPVSGEKVGEMGDIFKTEYNGKIYNLCCAMCAKDFQKDPEKYIQKVNEELEVSGESDAHTGHAH
jgi:YHS domain-containing protein